MPEIGVGVAREKGVGEEAEDESVGVGELLPEAPAGMG